MYSRLCWGARRELGAIDPGQELPGRSRYGCLRGGRTRPNKGCGNPEGRRVIQRRRLRGPWARLRRSAGSPGTEARTVYRDREKYAPELVKNDPALVARTLHELALDHLTQPGEAERRDLYRIFVYDCPPLAKD